MFLDKCLILDDDFQEFISSKENVFLKNTITTNNSLQYQAARGQHSYARISSNLILKNS